MITLAAATGLCFAVALGRYGRAGLLRLADLRLVHSWLLLLACGLQVALVAGLLAPLWCTLASALLIGSFALLNRRVPGLLLAGGGALLNMAVMIAYGGRMPVHPGVLQWLGATPDAGQILEGTKGVVGAGGSLLLLLGDWLPLPGAVSGVALWSVGDLILLAGVLTLLVRTMRGHSHAAVA